jgi:flagellar motor switch protein FliN
MAETQEDVTMEQAQADAKISAQTAEFAEAVETASASGENLNILLDIQMPITVVIGKTEVPFKRLLQLSPGSVLELDKAVGSTADLYVQDIQLATGDIVVVNDSYGIRIRQILGGQTIQNLKKTGNEKPQKA